MTPSGSPSIGAVARLAITSRPNLRQDPRAEARGGGDAHALVVEGGRIAADGEPAEAVAWYRESVTSA